MDNHGDNTLIWKENRTQSPSGCVSFGYNLRLPSFVIRDQACLSVAGRDGELWEDKVGCFSCHFCEERGELEVERG